MGNGAPGSGRTIWSDAGLPPAVGGVVSPESDPLARALGEIARIVAETLELKEVFARVAAAAGTVLPFDLMGLSRLEGPDTLTLYSFVGNVPGPPLVIPLDQFSPAVRPSGTGAQRFDDLAKVLDPSFPQDRKIQSDGMRSALINPLLRGDQPIGFVYVASKRPAAFTALHEAALRPIAGLLSLALEHERLWNLDGARRRRLDAIDSLFLTLSESLDVRGVFNQVSEVVKPVLTHDRLMLTSLSADRSEITVDAISGEPIPDFPTRMPVTGAACKPATEYVLIPDVEALPDQTQGPRAGCRHLGMRSLLKMPLRFEGGPGWLVFLSRTPGQYTEEDVVVARRVVDHISLALSHQRLAEEGRRAAEAGERASRLEERVDALRSELESTRGYGRVIGQSRKWKAVLNQAAKVAPTETTVLLTGESGTGKEVVARFIHRGSPRSRGPFVAVNCAALPETLLESELFGHEKGAFTGATASRAGRIEQAAGGVLFLDEVGEMTPLVQAKLLRVLQEREYQPLGGTRPVKADVRVVAATNRDLEAAMARGEFRDDLYYRLRVFEIRLPPLRERHDDILPMIESFLEEIGSTIGRTAAGISREARDVLLAHSWPGNVRELRNALERATILCDGGLITVEHLPFGAGHGASPGAGAEGSAGVESSAVAGGFPVAGGSAGAVPGSSVPGRGASADPLPPGGVNLDSMERDMVVKALRQAGNNRSQAARLLGITRSQLYSRLQRHGLDAGAEPRR